MQKTIAQKIKELPQSPGVYIFKDRAGTVLYVGKAVKLRNRVSSYFRKDGGKGSQRIQSMIAQIHGFDFAVTDNELESLVLENNFIKDFRPKYNVRMRDDKNYLFIRVNVQDEVPTITTEHKMSEREARYFGPYTDGGAARETLRTIRRIFPYCALSSVGTKPCFYYHIRKCPGVCFGKVTLAEYRQTVDKIMGFLEGKQSEVLQELQGHMRHLARHKQFEKAARVRDQIFYLNRVMERQKLIYSEDTSQDAFSLHMEPNVASINLFRVRGGKLVQKDNFIVENTRQLTEGEVMAGFLPQYYLDATTLPREILLPAQTDTSDLEPILSRRRIDFKMKAKTKIITPESGIKSQLIKMGQANARQHLESLSDKKLLEEARLLAALKELQRVLGLEKLPGRMECFDISNIQGTNAVGSMVVFDFARPRKDQYRKFKIRKKSTPDDFAMMREMLERRFARSLSGDGGKAARKWPLPDLVIIDGGKGQLSTAVSAMKAAGLDIPIMGLAKRLEEIFRPGSSIPVRLPDNSIALYLLQRIRDEAHRFAVTYHRKIRSKSAVSSALDDIQGIGPAKKKKLLQEFGSVSKIRAASLTDLSNVIGKSAAEKLKASL